MCEAAATAAYETFRQAFRHVIADNLITPEEWTWLQMEAQRLAVPWEHGLDYVLKDSLAFVERSLTFATGDGQIDEIAASRILDMLEPLRVPRDHARRVRRRIEYVKALAAVRQGRLPALKLAGVMLDPGEALHLHTSASHIKRMKHGPVSIDGTLLVTDAKVRFSADQESFAVSWRYVLSVSSYGHNVIVSTAEQQGDIKLRVDDPTWTEAVIAAALKAHKRQPFGAVANAGVGQVPQDVRIAVWQRDGGSCVRCGSSEYLEFDRVHPLPAGSVDTPHNVVLLCRQCLLQKREQS